MCGRAYQTFTEDEIALRYLSRRPIELDIKPNYNLCPTHLSPVVRVREGELKIELSKWGLIAFKPRPGEKATFAPINARSETVDEKAMFKQSFLKRRCILPVSGFFEWKRDGKNKQPYAIHGSKDKILSIAGFYNEIELEKGEVLDTFAILTTESNSMMQKIHDRMPVFLSAEGEKIWLDPQSKIEDLKKLFKPTPSSWLDSYPVSNAVNSPRNNAPAILGKLK